MNKFVRYQCWHDDRVAEVINKEAIAINIADFMATHAPLEQIAYIRPSGPTAVTEDDLLRELIQKAQSDQHVFAVIEGKPGTGKSHLIRWLSERCRSELGYQNEVLLIERAQNSLQATLRQIAQNIKDLSESLRAHIEKLRGAADTLSERALQDTLISNLAIATYERKVSSNNKIKRGIEQFLLDPKVREKLKSEDGPIARIAQFLTSGRDLDDEEIRPTFFADDFNFQPTTLRDIRSQGYPQVKDLAEALSLRSDLRADLAAYLNSLLDYTVTKTVTLSPDDLKQAFNDLRRDLRHRNRGLVLLIEDITSFTGLDAGLIDVLATQHTGENNRDFCRVVSVIGITDSYFNDHFPDNLKERITHHLNLNAAASDKVASTLLSSPSSVADFAGRYLNAMRIKRDDIQQWHSNSGHQTQVANSCDRCPFREPCHSAFGWVDIGRQDVEVRIGLYPFNKRAIWNIFSRLDEKIAKTPRSLLSYVLLDVLQSHGPNIRDGTFPPAPKDLATGIRMTHPLAKPVQQRTINEQGGADAPRILTLALYWGDGTIDARGAGASRTVGTLSKDVYQAFEIPPIQGIAVDSVDTVPARQPQNVKQIPSVITQKTQQPIISASAAKATDEPKIAEKMDLSEQRENTNVVPMTNGQPEEAHSPAITSVETDRLEGRFDSDIANWRDGGKLKNYEALRKHLINFVREAIDWEIHNVPEYIIAERIQDKNFEIQGQSGQAQGDRLTFERSHELADVLQALADLNDPRIGNIQPDVLGAHLITLQTWLGKVKPIIIDFAVSPTKDHPAPMRIAELVLLDCILIDWLCGKLQSGSTPSSILSTVVSSAASETSNHSLAQEEWASTLARTGSIHSDEWTYVLKQLPRRQVKECRSNLLRVLNLPQGASSDIRYIDAALGLQIISALTKRDWEMTSISAVHERAGTIWIDAGSIYQIFATKLSRVLDAERNFTQSKLEQLAKLCGDADPDSILAMLEQLLDVLSKHNKPHSLGKPPITAAALKSGIQHLSNTISQDSRTATALSMSSQSIHVENVTSILQYLGTVRDVVSAKISQSDKQIAQYENNAASATMEDQIFDLYNKARDHLSQKSSIPVGDASHAS